MSKIIKSQFTNVVLITEPLEIVPAAIKLLKEHGYQPVTTVKEKDSVIGLFIRTKTIIDKNMLDHYPSLQFILRSGVGLDNIDLLECKRRGVQVYHSPGANRSAVAEYVLGMAIYANRKVDIHRISLKEGLWRDMEHLGTSVLGKTFGLIGCGNIGKSLAPIVATLGSKVLGYDPYVTRSEMAKAQIIKSDLEIVINSSDILVILAGLTSETHQLMNKERLHNMKNGALLINVARGEIIDEEALIQLAKTNNLKAVLDVNIGEPHLNPRLLSTPNIIVTPHIAGLEETANTNIAVQAVKNLLNGRLYAN